jgi:hypothetical protein
VLSIHHAPPHPLDAASLALPAFPLALPLAGDFATDVTSPVSIFITSARPIAGILREGACRERQPHRQRQVENSSHLITSTNESSNRIATPSVNSFQRDSMDVAAPECKRCAGSHRIAQNLRDFGALCPGFELQKETPE